MCVWPWHPPACCYQNACRLTSLWLDTQQVMSVSPDVTDASSASLDVTDALQRESGCLHLLSPRAPVIVGMFLSMLLSSTHSLQSCCGTCMSAPLPLSLCHTSGVAQWSNDGVHQYCHVSSPTFTCTFTLYHPSSVQMMACTNCFSSVCRCSGPALNAAVLQ